VALSRRGRVGQRYVYFATMGNHEDSLASRQEACQARVDFSYC
jgi:hypothetical protein